MANAPVIDEIELRRDISREATGGPVGQTRIITAGNAREKRNVDWPDARSVWNVRWVARATDAKFHELINFMRARRHRAYGFRFFDWTDHSDWGQGLVLLDSSIGKYRLYKRYPDTIRPYTKVIYKPIEGTIVLSSVGAATPDDIDYDTGIVENATESGTWTGQFHLPARFDTDQPLFSVDPTLNVIWNGVDIIELV